MAKSVIRQFGEDWDRAVDLLAECALHLLPQVQEECAGELTPEAIGLAHKAADYLAHYFESDRQTILDWSVDPAAWSGESELPDYLIAHDPERRG